MSKSHLQLASDPPQPASSNGGDGGGNDGIKDRLARLETHMQYIATKEDFKVLEAEIKNHATKEDIKDIKIWVLTATVAGVLGGLGVVVGVVLVVTQVLNIAS